MKKIKSKEKMLTLLNSKFSKFIKENTGMTVDEIVLKVKEEMSPDLDNVTTKFIDEIIEVELTDIQKLTFESGVITDFLLKDEPIDRDWETFLP